MTVATFAEPFTGTDHDDFALWAREVREYRIERAYDPPHIELYDGDWVYRGTVRGELGGRVNPIVNQTGTISLRLPIDLDDRRGTWAAFWALDEDARGTSNIHVIVETMGARIGGRMKAKDGVHVERGPTGDVVVIDFLDDIEELKHVHTAGNPFLPLSLIQQPKAWMLLAQADHGILLTMAANLLRLQLANIDIATLFKLLDPDNWNIPELIDIFLNIWQQSQIVVVPRTFGDSVAPLSLVVGSIKTSIFDVAAPIMEDAELQWDLRRYKKGDPEPWPGAGTNWRTGTLFVRIVDKSGFRTGTSIGGNLATGLTRTIASVLSNHVEDSYDLFTGDTIDETGYRLPGILGTEAAHPYVTYRDGDITGIQTSNFSRSPGGAGRITVGGQSMPGVVCAPSGNRRGTGNLSKSMNSFQRPSSMAETYSETTSLPPSALPSVSTSASAHSVARSIRSSTRSTAIRSWRSCRCRCFCGQVGRAGATTWRPRARMSHRHLPRPRRWICADVGARPTPTPRSI
ncbi:hypothetical protein [Mycobacteroides chelonae]|uniref:Gp37-like protein n=1 Tax=Mycobacteroides chelonae TaxID=1774 RepID=UPI001E327A8C|nr:hypothetical protein [Mycobacteroides chelonae]